MNAALVDRIAQAVLYEGYMLYPYRPSVKNRHRWTFGGIFPRCYSQATAGAEPWLMQADCLLSGSERTRVTARLRFLRVLESTRGDQNWQEATEESTPLGPLFVSDLLAGPRRLRMNLPAREWAETGVRRRQQDIDAAVQVSTQCVRDSVFHLRVRVENHTVFATHPHTPAMDSLSSRVVASLYSLASLHMLFEVREGSFISLTDPPLELHAEAQSCENIGCWPVLVGEAGETDAMLAAPIILSEYPQVAPESPGDLFDATEIDEILTLRIATLTENEKREAAAMDSKVSELIARSEALARGQMGSLHGTLRALHPTGGSA